MVQQQNTPTVAPPEDQTDDRPAPSVGPKSDALGPESWSTARDLLPFAGTWVGDDLWDLLEEVKALRSEARF